ncbi:Catechol 2,3-dioxygenase-like lactoylglutathione lyase family enzyme OS=Streptomyces violarus OX=67380 GN=FHS41_000669 PE=4 SV=1 [Streptomyces violarus]
MSVEFNHTIVLSRDREKSARFLAEILGLEVGAPAGCSCR